jgi:AraC-like DNA-binding protein
MKQQEPSSRAPVMPGGAVALAGRADAADARPIRVLSALLGESPEAALLEEAVQPPAILHVAATRTGVITALRAARHDVIVFGTQDHDGLPTAPLISRCVRQQPGSTILLLCASPPPRTGALLAASRAGARVLVAPTVVDVASAIARAARLSAHDLVPDCDTLASVQPPMLQQLLCAASKAVAEDGRVHTLAGHLRVSPRTLSRHTQLANLAPPRVFLSAARLLWACAFMESSRCDLSAVARTTGFADQRALVIATRRHLPALSGASLMVHLPTYRDALGHVVGSLGGRLAP